MFFFSPCFSPLSFPLFSPLSLSMWVGVLRKNITTFNAPIARKRRGKDLPSLSPWFSSSTSSRKKADGVLPLYVAFCHFFHGCTQKELQQQQKAMKARCKLRGGKKVVVGTLNTIAKFSSSSPPLGTLCHLWGWFTINF